MAANNEIVRPTRRATRQSMAAVRDNLRQHYEASNSSQIEFLRQDSGGHPTGSVHVVINGQDIVPTLLKENTLVVSDWNNAKKPTFFSGEWPIINVDEIVGSRAQIKECGVCDENVDSCDCDYRAWSSAMQLFWMENIHISLTPGKGYGILARRDFTVKQVHGECNGELVPIDEAKSNEETQYAATIPIGKAKVTTKGTLASRQPECCIDATRKGSVFRFLNHSCDANCALQVARVGMKRRVLMAVATRRIADGEEITIDYGPRYFQQGESCQCGSKNCHFPTNSDLGR